MGRVPAVIELTEEEERDLRLVLRTPSAPLERATRARIVLRAAEGASNTQIAREVGVSLPTVGLWRRNFSERRMDGLETAPRSGRPREITDDEVQRVLAKTLDAPPDGTTHWSVRRLAAATGISSSTVHRIWREHKLKPHQVRSFKFSRDPELVEKVIDVVGLYLDPPKGALVLCVDEKTQIQALDRTQPTLPIKPGKAQRMTHDYKRNGTTSLYAALEIASGEVTGACYPRHTHQEFLTFLNRLVKAYPRRPLHVVLDNSSTHSTPEVNAWLARHPRVHFHFTPTSASWLNMVELWFSILTKQQVRRGVYHDVPELIAAIEHFIAGYNDQPNRSSGPRPPSRSSPRPPKNKTLQKRCTRQPRGTATCRSRSSKQPITRGVRATDIRIRWSSRNIGFENVARRLMACTSAGGRPERSTYNRSARVAATASGIDSAARRSRSVARRAPRHARVLSCRTYG